MSTLFVLKNIPVFFFKNAEKYGQNCIIFTPPSLSVSKQRRISILESQNTVRVSFTLLIGGGGATRAGGWTFKNVYEALFPRLWKKKCRDIFSQKRSWHAKFQQILSNLENRYEIVT